MVIFKILKNTDNIPVITIDGPSASGKGTVAQRVAGRLGFNYLDSGVLYRLVALKAIQSNVDLNNETLLVKLASNMNVSFNSEKILLEGSDVSTAIRVEQCGIVASKIATNVQVREALLAYQRAFHKLPGLVTDGRDMGSVIFPNATLKIFLHASIKVRADRRYNQLIENGMSATMSDLQKNIQLRDARDSNRGVAPLQQSEDTKLLDTSALSIVQATNQILKWYAQVSVDRV